MTVLGDAWGTLTTRVLPPVLVPASATPSTAPRISRALERRHRWERRYRWTLRTTDAVVVTSACLFAMLISVAGAGTATTAEVGVAAVVSSTTAACWLLMLSFCLTREPSMFGSGSTEYWRVAQATGLAFGLLAIVYLCLQLGGLRPQLLLALPLGLVALLVGRRVLRGWLLRRRAAGTYTARAIVVGHPVDIDHVVRTLADSRLGYDVVGACADDHGSDDGIYPIRGLSAVAESAAALDADTIIVASQPMGDPDYIKRLAWQLERTASELIVSSRIADVAGPRMSLRPVEGLPLLHVRIPTFQGGAYVAKRALDIVAATAALILLAPVAAVIAAAIALDSPGPVFFRQARVGRDGREFRMLKFRSMRVDAEQHLEALRAADEGAGPLFKLHDDPRVTRIGRMLRRYSLDELPQFWNVLVGDMSVVGPRPPLPAEVVAYDGTVLRRLYIKPGITGPWQVGGRSDLTWEESVRLDLRYVENWSVLSDLALMWRTVNVMLRPQGAY